MGNHLEDEYYRQMANDPRYLYVYVSVFSAWGLMENRDYHFLYDKESHDAICRDDENGRKVRLPLFHKRINPDRMFQCEPKTNQSFFDVTFYSITMKSGLQERELTIPSPIKRLYKPFYWILDTIDKDYGKHPHIERWLIRFVSFLCRILKPFNIGIVNEIAESIMSYTDDNTQTDDSKPSLQPKEKNPFWSQLNKFDPVISRSSRSKKTTTTNNQGRRKND